MDKSVVLIKNIDKTFKWNSEFKLKRSGLFIYRYMDQFKYKNYLGYTDQFGYKDYLRYTDYLRLSMDYPYKMIYLWIVSEMIK